MKLLLCLLSSCVAALVIASPHNIHVARHHAVAARAATVAIQADTLPLLNRRSSNRRCKNRSSSSAIPPSTPVSLNPSPSTSSSPQPDYLPTTTPTTPTTTPTPQPTTTTPSYSGNLPSFMYGVQTGDGTFFDVALGACGYTNQGTESVVAVSFRVFDNYPGYNGVNSNTNPICGKKITATYEGKSVTVTVVDRCADDSCLQGNLDFSRSAFTQLASLDAGRIHNVKWEWA